MQNLQEYENRIFADEEDDYIEGKNYNNYAFKYDVPKRPLSRGSNNIQYTNHQKSQSIKNKNDQYSKHMPDHLATKLVDNILNFKFFEEEKTNEN